MTARFWQRAVQFLLPTRCAVCQRVEPQVLCADCAAQLEYVGERHCLRCGRRRETTFASPDCGECHGQQLGVVRARSLLIYNAAGRELLAAFKFQGQTGAGHELARRLVEWVEQGWSKLYGEPDVAFDLVVPVPLHRSRVRERGFNQSELPARQIARRMELECAPEVVTRKRRTETQVGLSAYQRAENVRGAFEVPEGMRERLKGKRVLLVDDLMTTGATLAACARGLRRGGAASVHGLTLFSTHHAVEPAGNA